MKLADTEVDIIRKNIQGRIKSNAFMIKMLVIPLSVCFLYSFIVKSVWFSVFAVLFVVIMIGLNLSIKMDELRLDLMR